MKIYWKRPPHAPINPELDTERHVREHAGELRTLAYYAYTADHPALQIAAAAYDAAHALHKLANAIRETRRQRILKDNPGLPDESPPG